MHFAEVELCVTSPRTIKEFVTNIKFPTFPQGGFWWIFNWTIPSACTLESYHFQLVPNFV